MQTGKTRCLPPPRLYSYHTHDGFCLEQYEIFRALIPSFLPTFPLSFISFFPSFLTCSFPVVPGTKPSVCGDPAVGGLYERLAAVQDSRQVAGFLPQHQAQSVLSKGAWNWVESFPRDHGDYRIQRATKSTKYSVYPFVWKQKPRRRAGESRITPCLGHSDVSAP